MKNSVVKIYKYLNNIPIFEENIELSAHVNFDNSHYEKINNELNKNTDLIFLVGQLGSGKTTAILNLKKDNPQFHFRIKNFFGADNIKSCQFHLVGVFWNFINFFIFSLVFYFLINSELFPFFDKYEVKILLTTVVSFFVSYVVAPRSRFVLFLSILVPAIFFGIRSFFGEKRIIVIEDLDRSALSESERFSLLSQLPPVLGKYIVTYSYSDLEDKFKIVELANKLNAKIFFIASSREKIFSILKKYEFCPFDKSGAWMEQISIRAFSKIFIDAESNHGLKNIKCKIYIIKNCLEMLLKEILPPGRDVSDLNVKWDGKISYNISFSLTPNESELLNSFFSSINHVFLIDFIQKKTTQNEKDRAANWLEVGFSKNFGSISAFNEFIKN